jgi:hypothetical protein
VRSGNSQALRGASVVAVVSDAAAIVAVAIDATASAIAADAATAHCCQWRR